MLVVRLVVVLVIGIGMPYLHADSVLPNGGFESGTFAGWTAIGDAQVVGATYGNTPAGGSYQAMLTNAPGYLGLPPAALPAPNPNGSFSGTVAVDAFGGAGFSNPMDIFLGLPENTLRNFGFGLQAGAPNMGPTWEASALAITFTGNVGDVVTFAWNYLSNEHPGGAFFDFAFGALDGNLFLLQDSQSLVSTGSTPYFIYSSGYQIFSITLQTSGTHTLALGITDSGIDPAVDSALLLDNFQVTALPAPSSLAVLGIGFIVMAIVERRATLVRRIRRQ